MNLHIFNPEHDLSLSFNKPNFTPPHAARVLKRDLGFIMAFFADDGDYIIVEDCEKAKRRLCVFGDVINKVKFISFLELKEMFQNLEDTSHINILPWGWDYSIKENLIHCGIPEKVLPTDEYIQNVRNLSHRKQSQVLLKELTTINKTIGESFLCNNMQDINSCMERYKQCVFKAPWSCSGRGVRFSNERLCPSISGWINNIFHNDGSIMVEPYYNKICDFGMEFTVENNKTISYNGLSVFSTVNKAYSGSVLANEEYKENILLKYIDKTLLEQVKQRIIRCMNDILEGNYVGKFGVDMMIVKDFNRKDVLLHPCVEVNLRTTMGHVALALSPFYENNPMIMNVTSGEKCCVKLSMIENNFVNVL